MYIYFFFFSITEAYVTRYNNYEFPSSELKVFESVPYLSDYFLLYIVEVVDFGVNVYAKVVGKVLGAW